MKGVEYVIGCSFCGSTEHVSGHHIIPQKLMGDFIEDSEIFEDNIVNVCNSSHQTLEHLTRMIIYDGELDEDVQRRFRHYMEPGDWKGNKDKNSCAHANRKGERR